MKTYENLFLLFLLAALGCLGSNSAVAPSANVRFLLDGQHAPDILVESKELAWPPALTGSRFLTGWVPGKAPDGRRALYPPLAPQTARLELVNLSGKPSSLVLNFSAEPGALIGRVEIRCGEAELGSFRVTDPLQVELPMAKMPIGRVTVDLRFYDQNPGVVAAAFRSDRSQGFGRVDGSDLVQKADSLVDLVVPAPGDVVLSGAFEPPASPQPDQRFELSLEAEGRGPGDRFFWTTTLLNRLRGRRTIELRLRNVNGFVRARLRAIGNGPAGRWRSLALTAGTNSQAPEASSVLNSLNPTAPKLVVVYVMDALRADRLGSRNGASPTSDRLAAAGVTFAAHRCVAPNTLPSTKALFSGMTFLSRGGWKLVPEDGPTLAELFQKHGYRTGLFSGNDYVGPAFGMDRGFEYVAKDATVSEYGPGPKPPFNGSAGRANSSALAWLRSLPPGEHAFLYVHVIHPHNPYDPPEPFRSRYTHGIESTIDGGTTTLVRTKQHQVSLTAADQERIKGLYTGSFAYADAELQRFLSGLATWAAPSETLFALTADHGEELFDHGGILHGYTLYEELLRIPLVVWAPSRLRPARVEAPTSTLDLRAALLDLAEVERRELPKGATQLEADKVNRLEPKVHLAAASNVKGGIYSIQSARFKLIWAPRTGQGWGMGEGIGRSRDPEYLFDLKLDPGETTNLAGSDAFEVAWLRSRLLAWVERGRTSLGDAEQAPLDKETRDRLRALGYLN